MEIKATCTAYRKDRERNISDITQPNMEYREVREREKKTHVSDNTKGGVKYGETC